MLRRIKALSNVSGAERRLHGSRRRLGPKQDAGMLR
jgi:hypothetical protein